MNDAVPAPVVGTYELDVLAKCLLLRLARGQSPPPTWAIAALERDMARLQGHESEEVS